MKDLKYWKARHVDARNAVDQAISHLVSMEKAEDYAKKKVESLEKALKAGCTVLILAVCLLSGCANTFRGAGTLIKGIGQDITDAVDGQTQK